MTCKRPGCRYDSENYDSRGYCSLYCRDVDAYRQDALACYSELMRIKRFEFVRVVINIPELNHTYTEPADA